MGDRELYTGERLQTEEILDFICDHPGNEILVGFAFGYDVTMIMRDLSENRQRKLFQAREFGEGHSPYTWYKEFDIDYLPKNYLRVRRVRIVRNVDGSETRIVIKGSSRTIYETFGFFQKSFLKVLKEFKVATEVDLIEISENKDARAGFETITQKIRDYCALECVYLAKLMETFRGYCIDADIVPRSWSGAGKLAGAMHRKYSTPTAKQVNECIPPDVQAMANMAYYGGRFEITRVGSIEGEVYEYDIRSAYPAAMPNLPCVVHGKWFHCDNDQMYGAGKVYVANVSFRSARRGGAQDHFGKLNPLPIRSKEGHLYWPNEGNGTYWSSEIDAARRLGTTVTVCSAWVYEKQCDCKPFQWVESVYEYRKSIGSQGAGYPIKLGINALYGLLAQRRGNGVYTNLLWAGMITAMTRAKLIDAIIAAKPSSVIMIATDAIYSSEPIEGLDCGDKLGQWEDASLPGIFIVQPGLYWSPGLKKRKSRGLSGKFFEEPGRTESFENAWEVYRQAVNSGLEAEYPNVSVPVPGFIGLKLALSRNKPESAGRWIADQRTISFDPRNKRVHSRWEGGAIITAPKIGGRLCTSLPHRDFLAAGGGELWEAARLQMEEQPDYIDLGIPWKD